MDFPWTRGIFIGNLRLPDIFWPGHEHLDNSIQLLGFTRSGAGYWSTKVWFHPRRLASPGLGLWWQRGPKRGAGRCLKACWRNVPKFFWQVSKWGKLNGEKFPDWSTWFWLWEGGVDGQGNLQGCLQVIIGSWWLTAAFTASKGKLESHDLHGPLRQKRTG